MIKKFLQGVLALAIAAGCLVYVSNVTATDAPTLKAPVAVQIDAQKYYTDVVAADMVAREIVPVYKNSNGEDQTGAQITAGQTLKVKAFDVNAEGIPYFQVATGYVLADKTNLIVPKATASDYYVEKPVKVVTTKRLQTFTTAELKEATPKKVKKNRQLTVKNLVWTADGYPVLETNRGWISGKKQGIKDVPVYQAHAKAASSFDVTTGKFMYAKNLHEQLPSASTTKLMTLYLTEKHMRTTGASWGTKIHIDKRVSRLSHAFYGEIGMRPGETFTLKQLYEAAMIKSSNEAATQLGLWVTGGDNTKFVNMMNEQAKQWNLHDTQFYTASGLDVDDVAHYGLQCPGTPNKGRTYSSVHDLTMMADHLIKEYPEMLNISKISEAKIKKIPIKSTNWMLKGRSMYNPKLHVDGLKTGTTPAAGQVFVGTGQVPGKHRIITVVMHATDRFGETTKMMENAYDRFPMN